MVSDEIGVTEEVPVGVGVLIVFLGVTGGVGAGVLRPLPAGDAAAGSPETYLDTFCSSLRPSGVVVSLKSSGSLSASAVRTWLRHWLQFGKSSLQALQ